MHSISINILQCILNIKIFKGECLVISKQGQWYTRPDETIRSQFVLGEAEASCLTVRGKSYTLISLYVFSLYFQAPRNHSRIWSRSASFLRILPTQLQRHNRDPTPSMFLNNDFRYYWRPWDLMVFPYSKRLNLLSLSLRAIKVPLQTQAKLSLRPQLSH